MKTLQYARGSAPSTADNIINHCLYIFSDLQALLVNIFSKYQYECSWLIRFQAHSFRTHTNLVHARYELFAIFIYKLSKVCQALRHKLINDFCMRECNIANGDSLPIAHQMNTYTHTHTHRLSELTVKK